MRLTALELRGLTAFDAADFSFAPGINVFIGENGTGKSHALKVLYALIQGVRPSATLDDQGQTLRDELGAVFMPDAPGDLVRVGDEEATLWLRADGGEILCKLTERGDLLVSDPTSWREAPRALFIPSRETLAMYEGFISAYANRVLSFDKTYNDVCVALSGWPLRGEAREVADALTGPLQALLGGKVELRGSRFYVDLGDGFRGAQLVAEGQRKLAMLTRLGQNGSIQPGMILLWDEPEAGLNPKVIVKVAEALRRLAAGGVQVFVATHDYLLAHRLSLAAEHAVEPKVEMRFFSLYHDRPTDPVQVESGPTLANIQNNSILDEYAVHHDEERELYQEALRRDLGRDG
ncbi:MAG: AAA family ATPase [Polyangiaceae bacterium]|nr:AAA family ATPase [Polyangiaceae bacterium]